MLKYILKNHIEPLQTYEELKSTDRRTIEEGTPEHLLMDRAASLVALKVLEILDSTEPPKTVLVVAGRGNNGGDGFATAARLSDVGIDVEIWAPYGVPREGAAGFFHNLCTKKKIKVFKQKPRKKYSVLVDALFGAGFKGPPRDKKTLGELSQIESRFTVAVDLPSGVEANTGRDWGARKADYCITFSFKKVSHVFPPASLKCGEVLVGEIFLKRETEKTLFYEVKESIIEAINKAFEFPWNSHKYTRGHLAIISGYKGFEGAGVLSALGAAHTPAGLITTFSASPEIIKNHLPEGISRKLAKENLDEIKNYIENRKVKAIVAGPGLGELAGNVCELIKNINIPSVLDADCLKTACASKMLTSPEGEDKVFTPHRGEAKHLYGREFLDENSFVEFVLERPNLGGVHVLKGPATIIYEGKTQRAFIVPFGEPSLARGGSGDILSGIIGGFLAAGFSPLEAALLGVSLHALASKRFKVPLDSIFEALKSLIESS